MTNEKIQQIVRWVRINLLGQRFVPTVNGLWLTRKEVARLNDPRVWDLED